MNDNELFLRQQDAVARMREMNSRAVSSNSGNQPGHMPPVPPFVRIPGQESSRRSQQQSPAPKHQKPEPYENMPGGHIQSNNYSYQNGYRPEGQSLTQRGQQDSKNIQRRSDTAEKPAESTSPLFGGLNLPLLDIFKKDSDITLIIGLLLILISEKADKKLLFALIYILI